MELRMPVRIIRQTFNKRLKHLFEKLVFKINIIFRMIVFEDNLLQNPKNQIKKFLGILNPVFAGL